ncbi:MAG: glycoside hydrolase family 10 protein [Pyrinomonadaceae bacterium]
MLLLLIASVPLAVAPATTLTLPPPVRREFRDVWVATVSNIDWPSAPGLPVERQQAELIRILDLTRELNLNAIVLQVRPQCDALYASRLEPWSEYLTSRMGEPPQPFYDPLAFAVREAHARGLELHAWFNPYRALHASAKRSAAARAHTFTSRDQHAVHVVVSAVDRSGNESRPARVHK